MTFKQWILYFAEKQGFKKLVIENNKIVNEYYRDGTKETDENIIIGAIDYLGDIPFDSFDRLYALYLLDFHDEIVKNLDVKKALENRKYAEDYYNKSLDKENIRNEFERELFGLAYENYEREDVSKLEAFINIIKVAKEGKEVVLKDSYKTGGYFGGC